MMTLFEGACRSRSRLSALLLLGLLALACASSPVPSPVATSPEPSAPPATTVATTEPAPAETAAAEPAPAQQPPAADDGTPLMYRLEPPDGEWLVDDEGREYYLDKVPKVEGQYRWIDEEQTIVRMRFLAPQPIAAHDDAFFYFRVYRIERPEPPAEMTAASLQAIADTYRDSIDSRDKLLLVPFDKGLPKDGQWRNGFALADMNGDGLVDLVHGPQRKGLQLPSVHLNDGRGGWRRWTGLQFPNGLYDYGDIAVADFNGDGHQDLALAMHLTGVRVMIGDGQGKFSDWSRGLPIKLPKADREEKEDDETPSLFSSRALEAVDWNNDGRPDLLAYSEGSTGAVQAATNEGPPTGKRLFVNQGDGSWTMRQPEIEDHMIGDQIITVDLDRDGALDFVTDSRSLGVDDLLNYADGETWKTLKVPDARRLILVQSVTVADFNGDGWIDLALAFRSRELDTPRVGIDIYFGGEPDRDGLQPWRRASVLAQSEEPLVLFHRLTAGDLDNDGDADLVALRLDGEAWLLLNDGQGQFERELSPELTFGGRHYYCAGWDVELSDLDGDDVPELVVSYAGEPGSEQLYAGTELGRSRCQARGALRAYKISPRAAGSGPAGGS